MKNELMARAMTQIDYALIEEADEMPDRKSLAPSFMKNLTRYGGMAACMLLVVSALLLGSLRSPEVTLFGDEITKDARTINEYIPRAVTYSVSPAEIVPRTIPMELDFKRSTRLTVEEGEMVILDDSGDVLYSGTEYFAKGETSLCLSLPESTQRCVIVTDRGYNIVLNQDPTSGLWYVNIEK